MVLKITLISVGLLWYNITTKGVVTMPQIIPIRDLKNTTAISNLCHHTQEPVFITKNGYGIW